MTSEMTPYNGTTRSVIVLHQPSLYLSFIQKQRKSNKKQKGVGEHGERIEGGGIIYSTCVYVCIYTVVCMHSRDDLLSGEETNIRFPRRGNERRAKMAA